MNHICFFLCETVRFTMQSFSVYFWKTLHCIRDQFYLVLFGNWLKLYLSKWYRWNFLLSFKDQDKVSLPGTKHYSLFYPPPKKSKRERIKVFVIKERLVHSDHLLNAKHINGKLEVKFLDYLAKLLIFLIYCQEDYWPSIWFSPKVRTLNNKISDLLVTHEAFYSERRAGASMCLA